MPFNLNEFRNKLIHGGARPSQFNMRVTWPQLIPTGVAAAADFPFMCQVSEIPASKVGTIAVPYFGRKLYFAGDREVDTLQVTVINDEDFKIRKALESWMAAITGHSTTVSAFSGGITSDSYATDAEVQQYSRNNGGNSGAPIQAYKFVGLFPVNLGPIALDWNNENTIETFTVEFRYQWWEPVDANTGATVTLNV